MDWDAVGHDCGRMDAGLPEQGERRRETVARQASGESGELGFAASDVEVGVQVEDPQPGSRRAHAAPRSADPWRAATSPIVSIRRRPPSRSATASRRIASNAPRRPARSLARLNGWVQRWKTAPLRTARRSPRRALAMRLAIGITRRMPDRCNSNMEPGTFQRPGTACTGWDTAGGSAAT